MAFAHLPAGMPGTITWKAQQIGIPAYNLAMSAAGDPGHAGNQARFYMAMVRHQRLRHLAKAAAGVQQPSA